MIKELYLAQAAHWNIHGMQTQPAANKEHTKPSNKMLFQHEFNKTYIFQIDYLIRTQKIHN